MRNKVGYSIITLKLKVLGDVIISTLGRGLPKIPTIIRLRRRLGIN
jgi:hypothetical protein